DFSSASRSRSSRRPTRTGSPRAGRSLPEYPSRRYLAVTGTLYGGASACRSCREAITRRPMTTGGYPPPQSDPQNPGAYPGSNPQYGGPHNGQQYGGQQPGYPQPNDYTQQFPKQGGPGYTPDGGGQYGTPQYGNQYGAPQQGAPQYGAPQ